MNSFAAPFQPTHASPLRLPAPALDGDWRAKRRVAIFTLLALAHAALLVKLASDRVDIRRADEQHPAGALTAWVSTLIARPGKRRPSTPLPLPPRRIAAARAVLPLAPQALALPAAAIPEPQAIAAPPVDERLSGRFDDAGAAPAPGAASGPAGGALKLEVGKDFYTQEREREKHLTPAQEAMRDPRSNHLELTPAEKRLLAWGAVECIAWQRLPDGSLYRGPGHLQRVVPAPAGGHELKECVK